MLLRKAIKALLLIYSTISLAVSSKFNLLPSTDDQKLPKIICKISNDVIKSQNYTQDILIANFGAKTWSLTVNDIAQCINNDKAIVTADLKDVMKEKNLRKASVIILTLEWLSRVSFRIKKAKFYVTLR